MKPAPTRPHPVAWPLALLALAGCPQWSRVDRPGLASDCVPGDVGARSYDALAYDLSARFDWGTQTLMARERITLALCAGAPDTVVLDAAVAITRVHAGGLDLAFAVDPAAETVAVDLAPLDPASGPVTFEVEYRAGTSRALSATASSEADPVRSRVYFTDSEPRDGHSWLVEKDDPSDRALFSVELDVGPGEDAVANGERVAEGRLAGGGRRIRHALDVPIPTYLMAFAAGQLEHAERTYRPFPWSPAGRPPVALWWRRGLAIHPDDNLDAVEEAMDTFERLLGPYPFGRYAVVLLPGPFGGGMENATVTFNAESSGLGWVSFSLNAHELAHQWFGDWVTMRTYDDVWVKEGMATLLAAEAQRASRDRSRQGRLFGIDFAFRPQDAIVDPDLTGIAKYTSGPYGRAASLISQVRALVGEEAFWETCRTFLSEHALGSASGEDFVDAFAAHLDQGTLDHVLARLPAKDVPVVSVTAEAVADGTAATFEVSDPGGALLVPFEVTVIDGAGLAVRHALPSGGAVTLEVPSAGYLAPDERDLHPYPPLPPAGLLVPGAAGWASAAPFLSRSAGHQERALWYALPALGTGEVGRFLADLDSSLARRSALEDLCVVVGGSSAAWDATLAAELRTPPVLRFDSRLSACGTGVGRTFEEELRRLAADARPADLARLEYLLSFAYGDAGMAAIARVAQSGPSLELRELASARLAAPAGAARGLPGPAALASRRPPARDGGLPALEAEGKASRAAPR